MRWWRREGLKVAAKPPNRGRLWLVLKVAQCANRTLETPPFGRHAISSAVGAFTLKYVTLQRPVEEPATCAKHGEYPSVVGRSRSSGSQTYLPVSVDRTYLGMWLAAGLESACHICAMGLQGIERYTSCARVVGHLACVRWTGRRWPRQAQGWRRSSSTQPELSKPIPLTVQGPVPHRKHCVVSRPLQPTHARSRCRVSRRTLHSLRGTGRQRTTPRMP